MPNPRTLIGTVNGKDPLSVQQFCQRAAQQFDESPVAVRVTAGAEAVNVRRITLQTMDRLGQPWAGRFRVYAFIAATLGGDPGGTQTVALVSGAALQTVLPDTIWEFLTDANGRVVLDVTVAGVAARYVYTDLDGRPRASAAIEWS